MTERIFLRSERRQTEEHIFLLMMVFVEVLSSAPTDHRENWV